MVESFILVYALNLIGDFPLQGSFLATEKCKSNYILFVHSFIWASCVSFGFYLISMFNVYTFIVLLVGHYFIDFYKCRGLYGKIKQEHQLHIDQFLHVLQIMAVFYTNN